MRIVSLLASGTEIVCELGLEDRLVGISHECDHPERILDRPRVSRPRFDPEELSSREIDEAVRRILRAALLLRAQPVTGFRVAARLRYLLLEVTHVPRAATNDHMIGLGAMLRPLCRDLLVRTSLIAPRIEVLTACQPTAIGADLVEVEAWPADRQLSVIREFAARAGSQRTYLWGASRDAHLAAAAAAGHALINGLALAPDRAEPGEAVAMPHRTLTGTAGQDGA